MWIVFNRPFVICDSSYRISQLALRVTASVIGVGKLRVKLNGFTVGFNSILIIAMFVLNIPLIEMELWRQIP